MRLQAIDARPKTTLIWCHAGMSRRLKVKGMTDILHAALAQHQEHVFVDLSWVVDGDTLLEKLSPATRDRVGRTNRLELLAGDAPMIPRTCRYPNSR